MREKHTSLKLMEFYLTMRTAVVTLATHDYFVGAKNLFESLKNETFSEEFECYLFSNDSKPLSFFEGLFTNIVNLPEIPENVKSSSEVPRFKITLYKMYALKFLEDSNYDRIIFLDSDLMCLSSLKKLLSPDLNAFQFLAARDYASPFYFPSEIENLSLNPDTLFNTGCFILNRSILDLLSYENLISEITNTDNSYDGSDQGYLNYIVQKFNVSFGELPVHFNYPLDINYPLTLRPPALIHFTGEKPWNFSNRIPKWDKRLYKIYNVRLKKSGLRLLDKSLNRIHLFVIWNFRSIQILVHKGLSKRLKTK